jgi:hypothetical protein
MTSHLKTQIAPRQRGKACKEENTHLSEQVRHILQAQTSHMSQCIRQRPHNLSRALGGRWRSSGPLSLRLL